MSWPAAGPGRAADPAPFDAWSLARVLSPHPRVRVADVDEYGAAVNSYASTVPTSGPSPAPGRPYAIHLADERGRYRLLGFDLDARKGPVQADVDRLRELLTRARLPHVVCASGPGGGRHVWVALAQPVSAAAVAPIARGLRALLPSLDVSPLLNPRTGALRPPGAPHRSGGASEILDGHLTALLRPTAGPAQVLALAGLVQAAQPVLAPAVQAVATARDAAGHAYLTGTRRQLSARVKAALNDPLPAAADASAVLRTVLCGAVRARWHLAEVLALLPGRAPGLTHARSRRTPTGRETRPRDEQVKTLTREWHRAVEFVATHAQADAAVPVSDDPTYEPRCAAVTAAVAAVQRRAEAAPGRWAGGGGPGHRRVLDIACELMLTAVSPDIELDVRRVALLTGIGASTAARALHALAADGWLTPGAPAAGVHGAHWALPDTPADPRFDTPVELSTGGLHQGGTQGDARPYKDPSLRAAWLSHLRYRTSAVRHDALTRSGLGHHAARVYQVLTTIPAATAHLTVATGYPPARLRRLLDRLASHRLAKTDRDGHWRLLGRGHITGDRLRRAARRLGVDGLLVDRAARYTAEREAWAWWLAELAFRRLPVWQKKRVAGAGQQVLPGFDVHTRGRRGPHPATTSAGGFAAARRAMLAGIPTPRAAAA